MMIDVKCQDRLILMIELAIGTILIQIKCNFGWILGGFWVDSRCEVVGYRWLELTSAAFRRFSMCSFC